MPHCSSDACRQGARPCPTPMACGVIVVSQPSSQAPRLPRTYEPDYTLDGPFQGPRTTADWLIKAAVLIVIAGCLAAVFYPFTV